MIVAFSLKVLAFPVSLSCVRIIIALSVWRLGKEARLLSMTSYIHVNGELNGDLLDDTYNKLATYAI